MSIPVEIHICGIDRPVKEPVGRVDGNIESVSCDERAGTLDNNGDEIAGGFVCARIGIGVSAGGGIDVRCTDISHNTDDSILIKICGAGRLGNGTEPVVVNGLICVDDDVISLT
jgi:hypothetical protein